MCSLIRNSLAADNCSFRRKPISKLIFIQFAQIVIDENDSKHMISYDELLIGE